MLGLDKTQVFWPGVVLTSVIDMFMVLEEILTPVCFCFSNVKFITEYQLIKFVSLSIMMGCFDIFERS